MSTSPSIAPWLAVRDAQRAVDYYQAAFGAVELYRLAGDDGTLEVAQLSISPDPPIGRRRSGCGACRAEGDDEHGRERTRRCVTERAQETTPGSAASAPEMLARFGGFGLRGAVFWVQHDVDASPDGRGAGSVRMILSVENPDSVFAQAVAAGAGVVAPMHEGYGWRTGRVTDPFGHDWEMSKELPASRGPSAA